MPPTTIKNGKIDRGWTEQVGTGADAVGLTGRIKMTFRNGRPTKGKVAVDFGSCGTTTATPAGFVRFQAKRGRSAERQPGSAGSSLSAQSLRSRT